jgi:hypothetical protein
MKIITRAILDMETLEWVCEDSYEYEGLVVQCCGPTTAEQNIAGQQEQFSQQVQQNYGTLFKQQQGVNQNLSNIFTPIAEAGPNQNGMSAQQLAAENTQALDTTGANYANAARALNGQIAGHASDSGSTSGPEQQLQANLASTAAGQLSTEQLGITQRNADLGRQNFQEATGGLQSLSGDYSPNAAGSAANTASNQAFGDANTIAQQEAQEDQAISGAVTGGVMDAATFGAGAMGGGGFQGGLNALTGQA